MPKAQDVFGPRLTWLFKNVKKPDSGKRYSSDEVAAVVGVSPSYIRRLKVGMADNPTLSLVEALADFFGVDISFFFDRSETETKTLYLAKKIGSDPLLESIAMRASSLENADRAVVNEMLKAIIKIRAEEKEANSVD